MYNVTLTIDGLHGDSLWADLFFIVLWMSDGVERGMARENAGQDWVAWQLLLWFPLLLLLDLSW